MKGTRSPEELQEREPLIDRRTGKYVPCDIHKTKAGKLDAPGLEVDECRRCGREQRRVPGHRRW